MYIQHSARSQIASALCPVPGAKCPDPSLYSQRKLCHATEAAALLLLLLFPIRAIISMGCGCAPQVKRGIWSTVCCDIGKTENSILCSALLSSALALAARAVSICFMCVVAAPN